VARAEATVANVSTHIAEYYAGAAARDHDYWSANPDYVRLCTRAMVDALRLIPADAVADVGCGAGVFARQLHEEVRPERPILCVDPVPEMLERVPTGVGLRTLRAGAEDLAQGRVPLPDDRPLDAIILKESIHHLEDPGDTLHGLARLLSGHGRVLVVMLPRDIEHPLFGAAHERFRERQPEPEDIRRLLSEAGLRTSLSHRTFHVAIEREKYVGMLEERYMSVLGEFPADELAAGIAHFRRAYRDPVLRFDDHFAFVKGWV
jgi:ubiquinone/menaquinone biosynthesis C-methylase UbiE